MLLEVVMPRLVLTRKLNESVVLHDNTGVVATIKVSRINNKDVRLTFEADANIKIDREEIFNDKENIPPNA